MKKKLLVLENISQLDPQCAHCVRTNFIDWETKILYNLSDHSPDHIWSELIETDAVLFQSTFNDRTQMSSMLKLFNAASDVKPFAIYILYSYESLLGFINVDLEPDIKKELMQLFAKCDIYDVIHETKKEYEQKSDAMFKKNEFFSKLIIRTDPIKLYWNTDHNVLWHRRRPILRFQPDNMYPDDIKAAEKKYSTMAESINDLSRPERREFNRILHEAWRTLDYNRESLELGVPGITEEEAIELLEEKKERMALLEKIMYKNS